MKRLEQGLAHVGAHTALRSKMPRDQDLGPSFGPDWRASQASSFSLSLHSLSHKDGHGLAGWKELRVWLAGGHSGWLPTVAWARLRTLDPQLVQVPEV